MAAKTTKVATRLPLSVLPNGMLLRSLLIAGISSRPYVLIPSLKILSFLSKPNRSALFSVDKNPMIHAILRKTFYDQFCAGETGAETKQCVRRLKDLGLRGVILTYARETVFDHNSNTTAVQGVDSTGDANASNTAFCSNIDEWRTGTLKTIDLVEDDDYIALKYVSTITYGIYIYTYIHAY